MTDAFLDTIAAMPPSAFRVLRLLGGHLPYAALQLVPEPYATLTVLRDPVARSISHWRHTVREGHDVSLDEWAHSDGLAPIAGNYMARQLGHDPGLRGAWTQWSPADRLVALGGAADHPTPLLAWFQASPLGVSDEALHAAARRHLDAIDVVGVTEQLADVAHVVCRTWGFADVPVPSYNVAQNLSAEVPSRLRRRLEQINEVDRALHDRARERADELRTPA